MRIVIGIICLSLIAGCAGGGQDRTGPSAVQWLNEAQSSELAHLIISASAYPDEQAQPHWIGIGGSRYGMRGYWMSADAGLLSIGHSRYKVWTINFNETHERESGDILRVDGTTPFVTLKPGVIHYYGRMVVDRSGKQQRLRTELDIDLLQKACARHPELFEQFEVVVVGPLADIGATLPPCESS